VHSINSLLSLIPQIRNKFFSLSIKFDAISQKVVAQGQAFKDSTTYVLYKITWKVKGEDQGRLEGGKEKNHQPWPPMKYMVDSHPSERGEI